MSYDGKIPFDKDGNLVGYVNPRHHAELARYLWVENHVFESTLRILGTSRGRSAVRFDVEDMDGGRHGMFLTDFERVCKELVIDKGMVERAKWTFCKRGRNYGVCLV